MADIAELAPSALKDLARLAMDRLHAIENHRSWPGFGTQTPDTPEAIERAVQALIHKAKSNAH